MDSYINSGKRTRKQLKAPKPKSMSLSIDEKLKFFANLIVDRIIEDQKNGVIRLPNTKNT
jgi:hypothetical protein